jgi:long-chain acyl-CoA synthetase
MVMPTFHIAGTQWSLQSLLFGSTTIVLREFETGTVIDAIGRHRVTHMLLVPAMITLLLDDPTLKDADLSSVEMVSYGGSPFAPSTLAVALDVLRCRFFQTYGLTEAAGAVTTLHADDHDLGREYLLWSAGKPVPWSEVRIFDLHSGDELAPGEVGEICVRSPANMAGYWQIPNEVSGAFRGDWLRTGDAGYFDENGYLYLHDRVKDMIVTGGENVYPAEVENVLARHPGVGDVAVIGVPSDRWGEAVHAVVVRRDASTVTDTDLIEFARAEIAGFKLPKSVEFVADLPRNPSGKLLKRELRQRYWIEHPRAVG